MTNFCGHKLDVPKNCIICLRLKNMKQDEYSSNDEIYQEEHKNEIEN